MPIFGAAKKEMVNKIHATACRKCGSHQTKIGWVEGEKSSGMDIKPLRQSGMFQDCFTCGFSEPVNDLESNKMPAKQ